MVSHPVPPVTSATRADIRETCHSILQRVFGEPGPARGSASVDRRVETMLIRLSRCDITENVPGNFIPPSHRMQDVRSFKFNWQAVFMFIEPACSPVTGTSESESLSETRMLLVLVVHLIGCEAHRVSGDNQARGTTVHDSPRFRRRRPQRAMRCRCGGNGHEFPRISEDHHHSNRRLARGGTDSDDESESGPASASVRV